MGKIRERRRRERQKKRTIRWATRIGTLLVVFVLAFLFVNNLELSPTGAGSSLSGEPSESTEVVSSKDVVQIVMAGDVLMHQSVIESGKQEDGTYNFDHLFAHVAEFISKADLAMINQETILGGPQFGYTGYPSFNSPYEVADAEVKAGFDVLLLGTNHAYDKGEQGILNCLNYLVAMHPSVGYVGINRSQEEQDNTIYTYEVKGITIAILNYTYGHNGVTLPEDKKYLVNEMKEDKIRSDIRKAEEIADFTIVCPHWGTEFRLQPDKKQEELAQIFLEEGVDLVLGTHPHVIEPMKWLTHENGHKMLVYYSIGNFVNGTTSTGSGVANRMIGGIADILIGRNKDSGEVEIIKYGAVPVVCHVGQKTEYTVYHLEDYTEALASENWIVSQDSEFSKAYCESLIAQVWGE